MASAEDFVLRLVDQVSGPASAEAQALARLYEEALQAKGVLAALAAVKPRDDAGRFIPIDQIKAGAAALVAAGETETNAIKKTVAALKAKTKAEKDATGGAKKAAEGAKVNFGELGESIGKLGGPLGEAGAGVGRLGAGFQKLAGLGPAGMVAAVVVVVVALAAALAVATVAIAKWAIGLADANRNEQLATQGLATHHKALANIASILPSVQAATGLASNELGRMAEELAKAGVSAARMGPALKAVATATAGGASAEFINKLKASLAATGTVAKELQAEFAVLEATSKRKMLSLGAQGETLKRNISGVFGGLKIEPLLAAMAKLVALFDQNTASGRALKMIFEALFQPLIDAATAAIPYIERAFITVLTWGLKAYVAIKRFFNSPVGEALITGLKVLAVVIAVAMLPLIALGAAVAFVTAVLIAMATLPVVLVVAAITAIGAILNWLGGLVAGPWESLKAAAQSALDWLSGLSLSGIGSALIDGLVAGITGAAGAVVSAVTGAVGGAIDAAKSLLGIASPSKVFADIGMNTGLGMAGGVEKSTAVVQSSVADMVAPPDGKGGGGPSESKGGGPVFNFANCFFGEGMSEATVETMLRAALERGALGAET